MDLCFHSFIPKMASGINSLLVELHGPYFLRAFFWKASDRQGAVIQLSLSRYFVWRGILRNRELWKLAQTLLLLWAFCLRFGKHTENWIVSLCFTSHILADQLYTNSPFWTWEMYLKCQFGITGIIYHPTLLLCHLLHP